jgi:hypothetical protein
MAGLFAVGSPIWMKARWAHCVLNIAIISSKKFDRGEDVFEFCDMSAGAMKVLAKLKAL